MPILVRTHAPATAPIQSYQLTARAIASLLALSVTHPRGQYDTARVGKYLHHPWPQCSAGSRPRMCALDRHSVLAAGLLPLPATSSPFSTWTVARMARMGSPSHGRTRSVPVATRVSPAAKPTLLTLSVGRRGRHEYWKQHTDRSMVGKIRVRAVHSRPPSAVPATARQGGNDGLPVSPSGSMYPCIDVAVNVATPISFAPQTTHVAAGRFLFAYLNF